MGSGDGQAADLSSAPHARHLSVWFAVRGGVSRRIQWNFLPILWGVLTQSPFAQWPPKHMLNQ